MSKHIAFKSDKARKIALEMYANILAQWPVPYSSQFIETTFGKTHVLICGSKQSEPLVLLHGGGGNATMWFWNIAELAQHFCVYLIDIIGEPGRSAEIRFSYNSPAYANWLNEVYDGLELKSAALCGASLGGMFALQFAISFPKRVSALVLLAPPSILRLCPPFFIRAVLANIIPIDFFAKKFLYYISANASSFSDSEMQVFIAQFQAYNPSKEPIPVISDAKLRSLNVKTLLLLGEDEVIYDPHKAAERMKKLTSLVTVEIIPGAKHMTSIDQPELFHKKITQFIKNNI